MRVVLLLLFLISALPLRKRGIVLACSSNDFNSIYDVYPSCAVACLACPDAEYEGDFYNSCDYPSGICCLTQYRTVINATFTCVAQNCPGQAQKAFNVFVDFCADKDVPLDPSVVPAGYVLNTDADPSSSSTSSSSSATSSSRTSSTTSSSSSSSSSKPSLTESRTSSPSQTTSLTPPEASTPLPTHTTTQITTQTLIQTSTETPTPPPTHTSTVTSIQSTTETTTQRTTFTPTLSPSSTPSGTPSSSSSSTSDSPSPFPSHSSSLSQGALAGIIAGSALSLVFIVCAVAWYIWWRDRSRRTRAARMYPQDERMMEEADGGANAAAAVFQQQLVVPRRVFLGRRGYGGPVGGRAF